MAWADLAGVDDCAGAGRAGVGLQRTQHHLALGPLLAERATLARAGGAVRRLVVSVLPPPVPLAARRRPAAAAVAARRLSPLPRPVLVTVLGVVRRPVRLAVGRIAFTVGAVAAEPDALVEPAGPESVGVAGWA